MWGWFSAFREHGAPTFYGENRTPVTIDTQITSLFAVFLIPSLAYLCILPGVRKQKTVSTISFFICIFVGVTLFVSMYHPCWHRGEMDVSSAFRSFSSDRLDAHLLVRVGLAYMNISLTADGNATFGGMKYNERFSFTEIRHMEQELDKALRKGLPYPILKVIEYLSVDGFAWGRQYRVAGHYTASVLWLSLACWLMTVVCLCFLPPVFPHSLLSTGILIAIGDLIFITQLPKNMMIYFHTDKGSIPLKFKPSICFKATCFAALVCILVACSFLIADHRYGYKFDSIFSSTRNIEDSVVDRKRAKRARHVTLRSVSDNRVVYNY